MTVGVSLQHLVLYSLLVSGVLIWLTRRDAGFIGSALGILLQRRPWSLFLLGPIVFLGTVTVCMIMYNVLFATNRIR